MIGGTDVICPVRSDLPIADVIFRSVRRYWPQYVYQDADDETGPFTPHKGPWLPRPKGREFFVYRDKQAARSWDRYGATPKNTNTMLYVILPRERSVAPVPTSMTLVCGELQGEMAAMIGEIQTALKDSIESLRDRLVSNPKEAA
jgi:hypothetical protein